MDLDYAMIGGSRTNECTIKVAARLAQDVDDELKAVADDVAASRKVSYQMDDIGGYTYKPPDGPTQINIELLPLGGMAASPLSPWSSLLASFLWHTSTMLDVYTSSRVKCSTAQSPCSRRG